MKRSYFLLTFTTLFSYVLLQENKSDCYCVKSYLCRANGTIITDGDVKGIVHPRAGFECQEDEICCRLIGETESTSPTTTSSTTTTTTTPSTVAVTNTTTRDSSRSNACGFRNPNGIGFKIGGSGNNTEFGEFPWMIGILDNNGNYRCGGSLIHPSVVLTAAHCVTQGNSYTARAGEWDSSEKHYLYREQDRSISAIKIHEEYRPNIYYNDVALLFLRSPFILDGHVNLTCLVPPDTVVSDGRCYVTGWGKQKFGDSGEYPAILKKVDLPMLSRSSCQEKMRKTRLGQFYQLHRSFVCAGGEKDKDACIGDGGGPLVCPIPNQDNRYQQVGIVSWGLECNQEDVPGVYANVAHLRSWIDKEMKNKNFETTGYQY